MEGPFVGEFVHFDITFPEFKDASDNILPISGVTVYAERVSGAERVEATVSVTSDPQKYKAVFVPTVRGTWEAQARCTDPEVWHSPRVMFLVNNPPLSFTA